MGEGPQGTDRHANRAGSVTKRLLCIPAERISEFQTQGEGRGRWGRAARVRGGKSQALHTVAETRTGRSGGAAC